VTDWPAHVAREAARYRDGLDRVPDDPDARQKQLVRVANAAAGAGLASLMDGRDDAARSWLLRAAERYRESYEHAPAGSFGRLLGALKARLLAGDLEGARADAGWTLGEVDPGASPIGRYAALLAALVLGDERRAGALAASLRAEPEERFPRTVAEALAGLATADADLYAAGLRGTLESFEAREAFLEDVPVADTVLVLEVLARRRGLAVDPRSALLPASGVTTGKAGSTGTL